MVCTDMVTLAPNLYAWCVLIEHSKTRGAERDPSSKPQPVKARVLEYLELESIARPSQRPKMAFLFLTGAFRALNSEQ